MTIPCRRSMTKNGTPNTAGSSQNRYALGARGKAVWRTDRTRYSRAMSWAPGGTGGGGGGGGWGGAWWAVLVGAKGRKVGGVGVPAGELPDRQHTFGVGETWPQIGCHHRRMELLTRAWGNGFRGIECQSF